MEKNYVKDVTFDKSPLIDDLRFIDDQYVCKIRNSWFCGGIETLEVAEKALGLNNVKASKLSDIDKVFTKKEVKEFKSLKFRLAEETTAFVKCEKYGELQIKIPRGYCYNGANIVHSDDTRTAALVHDWLCENHVVCFNDRYLSTLIFVKLAEKTGCNAFYCWHLKHYVDNFQKVFGEWK